MHGCCEELRSARESFLSSTAPSVCSESWEEASEQHVFAVPAEMELDMAFSESSRDLKRGVGLRARASAQAVAGLARVLAAKQVRFFFFFFSFSHQSLFFASVFYYFLC